MENRPEPAVLDAHDLQKLGFSRATAYALLNRKDVPVITLGRRKYVNRVLFMVWLNAQSYSAGRSGGEAL